MVVDDSAVIRGSIARWLEEDPVIKVVSTASNGVIALRSLERFEPEVVVLDIEMPEMDGMTALPKLIEKSPDIQIIMASTLTARNADISIRALRAGAADYVPKPESTRDANAAVNFRRELTDKVKALGAALRRQRRQALPASLKRRFQVAPEEVGDVEAATFALRSWPQQFEPQIVAVGSSTGGPQALFHFFAGLKSPLPLPFLITQHMPKTFTPILASHIQRQTSHPAKEAEEDEVLKAGTIYVAPGDVHLSVVRSGGVARARLLDSPPENFCRPSVDPMLRSLAKSFGRHTLVVMLTGMGHDGRAGAQAVIDEGGVLIAQDAASSVVWGMPGAVARAGLCHAVLPLEDIAPKITNILAGVRP